MATASQIRRAINAWPGSMSSLARAAGVSHTTLLRTAAGAWAPTPELVEGLGKALTLTAQRCSRAAAALKAAR